MVDPFPLVGGKGLARLAAHGVGVAVGCEEERCREMNRPFLHRVRYGLPLGFCALAYADHGFRRPGLEVLRLGNGPKVLRMADAVVLMPEPGAEAEGRVELGAGLGAWEELEAAGVLAESVVRVVMAADVGAVDVGHGVWGVGGVGGRRVVVLTPAVAGAAAEASVGVLRGQGVEVVEVGAVGPLEVGGWLQGEGMLAALWLVGAEGAKAAVGAGVVHELWVRAALAEADELDGVETEGGELSWAARRFGRPMRVSVMSCDAVGSQACVLTLEVDEGAEEAEAAAGGDGGA